MKDGPRARPGALVRYPKGVKIKEQQHLDTLEQKSSKKLTGEREFGRVLLQEKKGRLKNLPESEGKKSLKSDDTPTK